MENRRYDYQPITARPGLRWPNDARLALWVSPNIEYFHIDQPIPNFGMSQVPDVRSYSQRDYGANRQGKTQDLQQNEAGHNDARAVN